jgi:hypothetical protein
MENFRNIRISSSATNISCGVRIPYPNEDLFKILRERVNKSKKGKYTKLKNKIKSLDCAFFIIRLTAEEIMHNEDDAEILKKVSETYKELHSKDGTFMGIVAVF